MLQSMESIKFMLIIFCKCHHHFPCRQYISTIAHLTRRLFESASGQRKSQQFGFLSICIRVESVIVCSIARHWNLWMVTRFLHAWVIRNICKSLNSTSNSAARCVQIEMHYRRLRGMKMWDMCVCAGAMVRWSAIILCRCEPFSHSLSY